MTLKLTHSTVHSLTQVCDSLTHSDTHSQPSHAPQAPLRSATSLPPSPGTMCAAGWTAAAAAIRRHTLSRCAALLCRLSAAAAARRRWSRACRTGRDPPWCDPGTCAAAMPRKRASGTSALAPCLVLSLVTDDVDSCRHRRTWMASRVCAVRRGRCVSVML
jgi:hypothetical protein